MKSLTWKDWLTMLAVVCSSICSTSHADDDYDVARQPQLVDVKRIWDEAPHNAFTDLIRFKSQWFCVFREGAGHVSPDGALRVITSTDGDQWESAALITSHDSDLRDAKITTTPSGKLMLCGAGALHDRSEYSHQSFAWFSDDGRNWSDAVEIGERDMWLWRVTWEKDKSFGVGYSVGDDRFVRLYESDDGRAFRPIVNRLYESGYPNESSIIFDGDRAFCLLRRDSTPATGLLGIATKPFTEWEWKDLGVRIGGPHMIRLPDGRLIAAVRLYDEKVRTSLCWVNPKDSAIVECLGLPSGGDTSYAGLVYEGGMLWISYYSTHEGKTSIYLARAVIPAIEPSNP